MALVTKNDVTQIFAIQAPEVDLPPIFANYPRGWDTARANNGKPTIKQFNYIQQRTDQNVLWMHQNGAALPYDAAMEYAENAHVVKDGVLQKKQGASWVKIAEWSSIENKPTTVAGYEISDTYTKMEVDNAFVENTQTASTTQAGIVQLVNDLTTGGADKALTAEMGKLFFEMFSGSIGGDDVVFRIPNPADQARPLIVQIGSVAQSVTAGVTNTRTFYVAFPNNVFQALVINGDVVTQPNAIVGLAQQLSTTSLGWRSNITSLCRMNFIAIGN